MIHILNLHEDPFNLIKNNLKTIEMRLNDEKRSKILPGDKITFINNITKENLTCDVINIAKFKNFKELYDFYPSYLLGYKPCEVAHYKDMNLYYSDEKIAFYGVLAITIKLSNN